MLRYLLDTNTISEPTRPAPAPHVLARLRAFTGVLAIPSLVLYELSYGCARLAPGQRRAQIETYITNVVLATVPILEYDTAAALWQAAERARLIAQGINPPFVDGQIAAIAATQRLTLVTRNVRDFAHYQGLMVEDWFVG